LGIVFEYPVAFLFFCPLAGALYAFILYFFDKRRKTAPRLIWGLMGLRFVSVTVIAMLLLSPLMKRTITTVEKPVVIVGTDNSLSIVLSGDSAWYRNTYRDQLNKVIDELKNRCEVKIYSFGDKLAPGLNATFTDKETDIGSFFTEIENRYANRNAGALIIATDGLYTKGLDPFYAARKIAFPIYSIALGDTNLREDVFIRKIVANKTVYKGDHFPVEVMIGLDKVNGSKSLVKLKQGARLLESKEISAREERSSVKTSFLVEAGKPGIERYTVQVEPLAGEVDKMNNSRDFFVEVLDTRQKIALVYDAPHPDITALLKAMEGSARFDIEQFPTGIFPAQADQFDLIVLYQFPSRTGLSNLNLLAKTKTSRLFILGSHSDINAFNSLKTGLIINTKPASFADVQVVVNQAFSLFSLEKEDAELFRGFPPLQAPFGTYQIAPLSETLFYQKSGSVTTSDPLLLFFTGPDSKIGVVAGENLWRWRIYDYVQNKDHVAFDRLINKIVRYLAVKEEKSFFRVTLKNRIGENEPVEIEAEVYNSSYEPITGPEVNMTITDLENNKYPYLLGRTNKAYYLNIGVLPVGLYSYEATTKVGNNHYRKSGKFFVEPINNEHFNIVADHQLLHRISKSHGGEVTPPHEMGQLVNKIVERDDFKPVVFTGKRFSDLIGNPWLFAAILALLTVEWSIRKRKGM